MDAEYHSSGQWTIDPKRALHKLESLEPEGALECVLAAIRGFVLSGASSIKIYSPGGHVQVEAEFDAAQVIAGECPLLNSEGWAPLLRGTWPGALLARQRGGFHDLALALWLSRDRLRSVEWSQARKVGGHLEFRGGEPGMMTGSRRNVEAAGNIQMRFRLHRPVGTPLSGFIKSACRFSPVPVTYDERPFEGSDTPSEFFPVLPEVGLPRGVILAEGTAYASSSALARLVCGSFSRATLEWDGAPDSGLTRMLLRTWLDGPGPFWREWSLPEGVVRIPLGTTVVQLFPDCAEENGQLIVVRGGVAIEALPLRAWGACVICSDEGLNLDLGGRRVIHDEVFTARLAEAARLIKDLAADCLEALEHARFWTTAQPDLSLKAMLRYVSDVVRQQPDAAMRWFVCEDRDKIAKYGAEVRRRLAAIGRRSGEP